ncbi:hypothetical protein HF1_12410 [Mycoplasma haemofelis str. Langford 1]|uniref:Uncharacterized protein n=1 Tax=Mycoplasma haemofelis (strain Langford 1) TaxID=941640 RepID=E8ZJC8_MYCHL|nr:hypothetical protein [Mycoplasma haemofelis]CBY93249.1 hypothetical protein HF1_12410 [Mycoplasma haemofelis str. Langford 1]
MSARIKLGLGGVLASLISGSVGAYLGLEEKEDPSITKVLSLDSQTTSKFGKCKVRLENIGGESGTEHSYSYSEFYKERGDKKGVLANACLKKLDKDVDKGEENAVAVLEEKNGDWIVKEWKIVQQ